MINGKKLTIVMGGGGVKGLAHIGALKAFHRYGLVPDEFVGTSVGAFIAALAAGGMSPKEIEETALTMRRKDILDYNWLGLLWRRGRARSLYRGKAFHDFVRRTLPVDRFDQLLMPLYITSVDLASAREVIWGMPGYTEVPIHDCVVASCAIPGVFPPKKIGAYYFLDGSLVDTLPVKIAVYTKADMILAVYLEPREGTVQGVERKGIAAILQQSQSILSRTLARHNLHYFEKSPIVLVQPRVADHGMFDFDNIEAVIRAGEEAAEAAMHSHPMMRPFLPAPDAPGTAPRPDATPPPLPAQPEPA
jgi:NTE family protein